MDRRAFKSIKTSGKHRPTLVDLVRRRGWKAGAEVGVDKGILFDLLLASCPDLRLVGVDSWEQYEHRQEKCRGIETKYPGRAKIVHARSTVAAKACPDHEFDFVFIDAAHDYENVKADIAAWRSKVKPGGWLGGHDYHERKFPGVVRAVKEAFGNKALHYDGWIWGVDV